MSGRWDLGFPVAVTVVLLMVYHVITALVRRRWRLAEAGREEIVHLVQLAAEETARAEMEAALAYVPTSPAPLKIFYGSSVSSTRLFGCAVCYKPTTTRCSRCKAVRYWYYIIGSSGKCQIIHWRQGHRDECRRPLVDEDDEHQDYFSFHSGPQVQNSKIFPNSFGNERKPYNSSVRTCFKSPSISNLSTVVLSEEHKKETKPLSDSSGAESNSGSFVDSSSSCFADSVEEDSPIKADKKGFHIFLDNSNNTDDANSIRVPSAAISSDSLSAIDSSCIINSKNKLPTLNANDTKNSLNSQGAGIDKIRRASFNSDSSHVPSRHSGLGRTSTTRSSDENTCGKFPDECESHSYMRVHRNMGTDNDTAPGRRITELWLVRSKRLRSLTVTFADRAISAGRRRSVSDVSSSKAASATAVPAKLPKNGSLISNSIYDLKASIKKAVHQCKSSQISRGHTSAPTCKLSQNYKMFFPYELFVELYHSDKVDMKPFGLLNCGNSCYANAVLQCLAYTRPLTAYFLQGFHTRTCLKWCFTCEFESLILKANLGQSPLSPVGILSHVDKIGNLWHGREEDAHEFLRYAIDAMQSACIREAEGVVSDQVSKNNSLIQLTFGGYLMSEIKCMKCWANSEQLEPMMDLTVEIDGDIRTLEEALLQFTSAELMDGENRYDCIRCKSFERARKKLSVFEAPNALTIVLKRFQLGKFGKLNKSIMFPEQLDLAPYLSRLDPSPLYSLYAIVVHQDVLNAAFSGHYICFVKSMKGKWYMVNDSKVKLVELHTVLGQNAYMLFYTRSSPQAPGVIGSRKIRAPLKAKNWFRAASIERFSSISHQGSEDRLHQTAGHPSGHQHSDVMERLYFQRTDSSSDNLSLSCSDESSWRTESTRDSTSTEELSDYLFGAAPQPKWSQHFHSPEGPGYITNFPSTSGHSFHQEEDGECLGGREGLFSCNLFLFNDRTNQSSIAPENFRGRRETNLSSHFWERSSVLMRSCSTVRERRHPTLC